MNLMDKLRAVGGSGGTKKTAAAAEPASQDCRHTAVCRPGEEFPGAWELTGETLALMSGKEIPADLDPRRILYLDTETTGLGGSGTVAFLVGMGWLNDEGFEVHQFLMRDYPEEPYLLKHVAAGLERFDVLCTFNGSTFDVPLLESRLLMNRMDRSCLEMPHIDLLHMSRRLWKLRLGRCNLSRLEEAILVQPREEDLPGSEVPQRYFDYLKTKREDLLDDMCSDMFGHVFEGVNAYCVGHEDLADMSLTGKLAHLLYHLRDSYNGVCGKLIAEGEPHFTARFKRELEVLFAREAGAAGAAGSDVPADLRAAMHASAFMEAVSWWLDRGADVAPEQLAAWAVTR